MFGNSLGIEFNNPTRSIIRRADFNLRLQFRQLMQPQLTLQLPVAQRIPDHFAGGGVISFIHSTLHQPRHIGWKSNGQSFNRAHAGLLSHWIWIILYHTFEAGAACPLAGRLARTPSEKGLLQIAGKVSLAASRKGP